MSYVYGLGDAQEDEARRFEMQYGWLHELTIKCPKCGKTECVEVEFTRFGRYNVFVGRKSVKILMNILNMNIGFGINKSKSKPMTLKRRGNHQSLIPYGCSSNWQHAMAIHCA